MVIILAVLLTIPWIMTVLDASSAASLVDSYQKLQQQYPQYIEDLKEGGASEQEIKDFLNDLNAETIRRGPLNEQNFDDVLYDSLQEVILWRIHRPIFIAMTRSFGEEIDYTLETGTLHPNLLPLREAVKAAVLSSDNPVTPPAGGGSTGGGSSGGSSGGGSSGGVPVVPVTEVKLDQYQLTMKVNTETSLLATVLPDSASNKALIWRSIQSGIAKVDQDGNITAVAVGSTSIIVRSQDGEKTASCSVNVIKESAPVLEGNEWEAKDNISLDHAWQIKFSKEVDISSIDESSIYVCDARGEKIPLQYSLASDQRTVIASPQQEYEAGKVYYLQISSQLKPAAASGVTTLKNPVWMKFTTIQT